MRDMELKHARRPGTALFFAIRIALWMIKKLLDLIEFLDPDGDTGPRYVMGFGEPVILGTAKALHFSQSPLTTMKLERLTFNSPCFGFVTICAIEINNMLISIGDQFDAAQFSTTGEWIKLKGEWITPSDTVTFIGTYTGLVPPGYTEGKEYRVCATVSGPARRQVS